MKMTTHSLKSRFVACGLGMGTLLLAGCGVTAKDLASAPVTVAGQALQGKVHGGQQPVAGATIQLYAVGTGGYGSASYALLTKAVTTDSGGNFTITGDYTCPSATSMTYITATGGNPGFSNNANLALMATLGACGNLTAATQISINELTTVAGVYALAPFMSGYASVGSSTTNTAGLTAAFATSNKLANIGTGVLPGPALPAGATLPTAELNTLADIIASCVNSAGGTAGGSNNCGTLFTLTTSGTTAPTDTIGALLNIAKNPGNNAPQLLTLAMPNSPFQPTLTSATDFTVAIKYQTGGFNAPSASSLDASGNLWVTNAGNNSVSVLSNTGAPVAGSPFTGGGLNAPAGVAIDASGNGWITDRLGNAISVFTAAGTGTQVYSSGSTLKYPTGISIDGAGTVWVTNAGSNSVTALATSGTTVTGATNYTTAGVNTPGAVAINPH